MQYIILFLIACTSLATAKDIARDDIAEERTFHDAGRGSPSDCDHTKCSTDDNNSGPVCAEELGKDKYTEHLTMCAYRKAKCEGRQSGRPIIYRGTKKDRNDCSVPDPDDGVIIYTPENKKPCMACPNYPACRAGEIEQKVKYIDANACNKECTRIDCEVYTPRKNKPCMACPNYPACRAGEIERKVKYIDANACNKECTRIDCLVCNWIDSADGCSGGECGVDTEVYVGIYTPSECIKRCVTEGKSDSTINGATRNKDNGKCWCEKGMDNTPTDDKYKTCYLTGSKKDASTKLLELTNSIIDKLQSIQDSLVED